jgi:ribonuclease BN (tRNA processing enzyme)
MVSRYFLRRLVALLIAAGLLIGQTVCAQSPAKTLELVVLGSGGPGATGRAGASYLLLIDGSPRILVDAGPGAFVRVGEAGLSLANTDIVLLTHLHVDHAGGLAGLFKARAVSGADQITFNVWGPAGSAQGGAGAFFPSTSRFLELLFGKHGAFAYLQDFATPMKIQAHDISVSAAGAPSPQVIFEEGDMVIKAVAGHHFDAPAVIYRIEHAGKSITFSGDIDAHGLGALRSIAKGSDVLVFNSVVRDPPGSRATLYELHTPPLAIGEVSRDAGVHHLLLSHLSPAVETHRDEVLESIRRNYQGSVEFAEDGMHVSVAN